MNRRLLHSLATEERREIEMWVVEAGARRTEDSMSLLSEHSHFVAPFSYLSLLVEGEHGNLDPKSQCIPMVAIQL
jgi:hypothetical protein